MPYRRLLQPYAFYVSLGFTALVMVFNDCYKFILTSLIVSTFVTPYLGIIIYLLDVFGYKLLMKSKKMKLKEAGLSTGRLQNDGKKYPSTMHKIWTWVTDTVRP